MTAEATFTSTPYPGLRAFEPEEVDIFFGRERQSDQLLATLQSKRFLAVVGPSGCGKSSLVRAGLIAPLRTGFMVDAGSSWKIALLRPGNRPIQRLADALFASGMLDVGGAEAAQARLFVEAALRAGPRGLVELVAEANRPGDNLLVLVDQFEELFRFRASADRDEAEAFVELLLAAAAQQEQRIYVVLTMRSDFLGESGLFHGLPEAINGGQYLTPRLTRDECQMAIVGPAKVFGGQIAGDLVNRLLNDFGPDPDRLPLLQHALLRMWQRGLANAAGGAVLLSVEDYDQIGGLASALSNHAEEALNELAPAQRSLAELLFKRISERGVGRRDTRAPARLGEVAAAAGVTVEEVAAVVEVFRRPDRCFLTPREGPLAADTVVDLSHESLIRQWITLARWVDEEADSAAIYGRLKETARLWKKGDAGLWGTPDLDRALKWQKERSSTAAWAARYGTAEDYELAREFLAESERVRAAEAAQREAARLRSLRRARRIALGFGLATLGLATFVVIYGYLAIFEHTAYFNTFTKRWGAPQGVGPLTSSQIRHRTASLRITRHGRLGRVLRMEAVDGEGRLTTNHTVRNYLDHETAPEESSWEFVYDQGGVLYELARDPRGARVWGFIYAPASRGARERTGYFVGPDGFPRSGARYDSVVSVKYDEGGLEVERRYHSRSGEPRPGPDHAFGQTSVYDEQGRRVRLTSIDREGKPMDDTAGNATLEEKLDDLGNPIENTARDAKGSMTWMKEGWSRRVFGWDENGNLLRDEYLDDKGRPTTVRDGYQRVEYLRDERGNAVEQRHFGLGKETATDEQGCHAYIRRYDQRNRVMALTCLDAHDQPSPNHEGVTTSKYEYDDADRLRAATSYDAQEHQVNSTAGYSREQLQYNAQGKLTDRRYLDPTGQPAVLKDGQSRMVDTYDWRGQQTGSSVFGPDGAPAMTPEGWASWTQRYDSSGHVLERNYFGLKGQAAIIDKGYAGWRARYDADGNKIEVLYQGERGRPVFCQGGYAGWRAGFDLVGNQTSLVYLGTEGQPVIASSGVAGWTSSFDAAGHEIERHYLDAAGKPTPAREGYAGWRSVYDKRGNEIEEHLLDVAGRAAAVPWDSSDAGKGTYSSTKRTFDQQRNLLTEAYFGVHGQPVSNLSGWARVEHGYDARQNQVKSAYYGVAGQPVIIAGGYHRVERAHREQGHDIEVAYFGIDGTPILGKEGYARLRTRTDRLGRLIEQAMFGLDGAPAYLPEGFHRETRTVDDRGRITELRYFGGDGRPVVRRDGYHGVHRSYDARGNQTEESYFGLRGEPTVDRSDGYARVTYRLDLRGDVTEISYFGADGRPVVSGGAAVLRMKLGPRRWAADNRETLLVEMLDADGRPRPQKGAYSQIRRKYDDFGNVLEKTFLDAAGRPVRNTKLGYATETSRFDTLGNLVESAYFDAEGKATSQDGYHRLVSKFSDLRQLAEVSTFDTRGNPVLGSSRCARFVRSYDENGRLTSITTYDTAGHLTIAKHGYARMTLAYDQFGNQVEEAYYGPSGRLLPIDGVARTETKYDDRGDAIEAKFFGTSNTPLHPVARSVRIYDHRHLITEERLYDAKGRPARLQGDGPHIVKREYDAAGNKIAEYYLGLRNEKVFGPTPSGEWCTRWNARYDVTGKQISQGCNPSDRLMSELALRLKQSP